MLVNVRLSQMANGKWVNGKWVKVDLFQFYHFSLLCHWNGLVVARYYNELTIKQRHEEIGNF